MNVFRQGNGSTHCYIPNRNILRCGLGRYFYDCRQHQCCPGCQEVLPTNFHAWGPPMQLPIGQYLLWMLIQDDLLSHTRYIEARLAQIEQRIQLLGVEFRDLFQAFIEEWKQ